MSEKITRKQVSVKGFSEYGPAIAELQEDVAALQEDVTALDGTVDDLSDTVGGVSEDLGDLASTVEDLGGTVSDLGNTVDDLGLTVSGLSDDVDTVSNDLDDLENVIGDTTSLGQETLMSKLNRAASSAFATETFVYDKSPNRKIKLDIICSDNTVYTAETLPTTTSSYELKKNTNTPKTTAPTQDASYEDAWNKIAGEIATEVNPTTDNTNMYDLPVIGSYLDIRLLYNVNATTGMAAGILYPSNINYSVMSYNSSQNKYTITGTCMFDTIENNKIVHITASISAAFIFDGSTFTDSAYSVTSVLKNTYSLS